MKQSKTLFLSTDALSIGHVTRKKEVTLFKDLNLELYAGQLVCFMGPNGIGKSSLIRTLAQLQQPLSGEIKIHSQADKTTHAQQLAVVLTDRMTVVNMTVYETIAFGRYPYLDWKIKLDEVDKKIIDDAIDQIHIGHLRNSKLHELSDGQLQMVMIARALAQDTPIILLDEPTAHLDLNNRVEVMKLLRNLSRRTNKAILVSTHELDLALQLADWIWLAGREQNILTGMPEDLVLNGSFDAIFQFKGFDLRSGKVQFEKTGDIIIGLRGDGHEYLWTKNALERHGFIVSDNQTLNLHLQKKHGVLQWVLDQSGKVTTYSNLYDVINELNGQSFAITKT
jgi:iron complex transport system ATP-binding protein